MAQEAGQWRGLLSTLSRLTLVVGLGAVGLLMMHHPMILSGFEAIQTDLGDSRLILYLLEHTWLWVQQAPGHQDLWSPPFFFPARNIGAYSDLLLTPAPLYWAWRGLGLARDSAFQAWIITISACNYGSALLLLRRGYHFPWLGAAAGSFLIAFGAPRVNMLGHQQLMPFFFVALTLLALARLGDDPRPSRVGRWAWWQVAGLGIVAQLYAAFYIGWFLILALGLAGVWGLILPRTRSRLLWVLVRDAPAILAALVVVGLALIPFLTHYRAASREVGYRDWSYVRLSILVPWSWLDLGSGHWLAGWSANWAGFGQPLLHEERRVGVGLMTLAICLGGWWVARSRAVVQLAATVALTLALGTTFLPHESIANVALLVVLLITALLDHDRSQPALSLRALVVLIVLLTLARFPSWRELGLIGVLLALGTVDALRHRHNPARLALSLGVILWLCLLIFDPTVMAIGLGLVSLAVLAWEILRRPADRALVRVRAVGVWLVLVGVITLPDRPEVWGVVLLTPLLVRVARWRPWGRAGTRSLVLTLGVALGVMIVVEGRDTLWSLVYDRVPGGQAIRGVGRVGLAVLVPLGLGAAAFFASPWARRHPAWAGLIGVVCVLEQGITTPSYNKRVERERIAALAQRIDPTGPAFYYRPRQAVLPYYQIDALGASLQTGVATVNGYSGGWPRAWFPLVRVDWDRTMKPIPSTALNPRQALAEWLHASGLRLDQVQIIEAEDDIDRPQPPPSVPPAPK